MSFFGLACSKAGGTPLQGDCGGFDSLRVHKMELQDSCLEKQGWHMSAMSQVPFYAELVQR